MLSFVPPPKAHKDIHALDASKRNLRAATSGSGTDNEDTLEDRGRLAPAKILMKILYGARGVRLDLLRIVGSLACYFTRWTSECDRRLHRLVCYINSSLALLQVGWVGDQLEDVQPHLFADAEFAGCVTTQRSTRSLLGNPRSQHLLSHCWSK